MPSVKRIDYGFSFGSSIVVEKKANSQQPTAHIVIQHIFIRCLILNSQWKSIRTCHNDVINGDTGTAISFCIHICSPNTVFTGEMVFVSLVKCFWCSLLVFFYYIFHYVLLLSFGKSNFYLYITARRHTQRAFRKHLASALASDIVIPPVKWMWCTVICDCIIIVVYFN